MSYTFVWEFLVRSKIWVLDMLQVDRIQKVPPLTGVGSIFDWEYGVV